MIDLLVGDIFRTAAGASPNHVAVSLDHRQFSYAELERVGNQYAHALAGLGVRSGDRVVLWSFTEIDAVPLFVGLAKLGAVFAPANALLGVDEASEMIALARPSALVVDETHRAGGATIAERLGIPVVQLGSMVDETTPDHDVVVPALSERDSHVLFFTSGSTGKSKGVVLSHRVNYLRSHPGSQLEPRGTTVCMYPLFHMGAWTIALQAFHTHTTLVLVPQADPNLVCDAVEFWQATHINAIPAVWQRILDHLSERREAGMARDLSSLRIVDSGTSATPLSLLDAIREAMPTAHRRVFYGSTEAGGVTLLRDADMARKPGSCGTVQHSCIIRLDPASGEMQVHGPLLFDGYFDNPAATAESFTEDGWFRTGDVAVRDEEGFYSIVGRVKDVIRTGGESVAPAEVEAALADHPKLADVAVVGIPDTQWGEVVCAAIVPREGEKPLTLVDVQDYVEGRLARFKRPRRVEVVERIPRTPATNQVQRRILVEQLLSR